MTDWLDDLRLESGPPFLAMGMHALRLDEWLIVDDDRAADLAVKADLLRTDRASVFAAMDGTHEASAELLEMVREWLTAHGIAVPTSDADEHPLIAAARLVQEDLALLQYVDGEWVLTAGAICFPTHWTIGDKVGLPLEGVHAPVAHYESELREKVDRFHDRLAVDRPAWRRNWIVADTNALHLRAYGGPIHHVPVIQPDGSPMWIRSERQTLRRLQQTDAIVFTVRVQRAPLGVLLERPDLAGRMLAATRSWDARKRMYASTGGALDQLNEWLERVAGGAHPTT
ncbi:unannotated protein [freshwater metagenome]|uniref:Unannotated protein n=1 Tax=freshwater metagenome TaxID=449393 RepID=A0A6J7EQT9_9ZZZZ|nr:DUF3445 domain-containing protein [Actinomycetota bacterium]